MCIRDSLRTEPNALKILITAETYPPDVNGAAQFGRRLAHGLLERGHEVHVAAPMPTRGASRTMEDHGITEPVSYTHLDVYKRQTTRWPTRRSSG